ncbi:hypothetical protein [Bacillus safensis FO-36b] [Bacillus safensis subsp. safensis]
MAGEQAAARLVLLGSVLGIGYGFYWLAFNVLTFEITEPETRDFFNGLLGVLSSTAGMIGPLIAGIVISQLTDDTGYTVIFTLSALFVFTSGCDELFPQKKAVKRQIYDQTNLERTSCR